MALDELGFRVSDEGTKGSGRARVIGRWVIAAAMCAIGVRHFTDPEPFVRIVPRALPAPLWLVWVSGAAEIAGGLGLLWKPTRRAAGWGLVALFVAVFPANINMAVNNIAVGDRALPPALVWGRLLLQPVFIALAVWAAELRRERGAP